MASNLLKRKTKIKSAINRYTFLSLFHFLIRENIFISLCSVFFFLSGYIIIGSGIPALKYQSLIFWATLLIYQVNTRIKFNFFDLDSYALLKPTFNKRSQVLIFLGTVLAFHALLIDFKTLLFLIHLGIISTLYNVPESTRKKIYLPLRSIPFLKIFLIAYVWASISSFLPAIMENEPFLLKKIMVVFTAHFSFIFAITLPFDIRDFQADKDSLLKTTPGLIGILPTKIFALISYLSFAMLSYYEVNPLALILFSIVVIGLIIGSSPERKGYYYTFFMDGTIILYFFLVYFSHNNL